MVDTRHVGVADMRNRSRNKFRWHHKRRVVMTWMLMVGNQLKYETRTIHLAGMLVSKMIQTDERRNINTL